jgi:hypothetical protein
VSNTRFSFEKLSLDCDDLDAVHEFLVASDFVKATDELEFLVQQNWPELLHKLIPPLRKMH